MKMQNVALIAKAAPAKAGAFLMQHFFKNDIDSVFGYAAQDNVCVVDAPTAVVRAINENLDVDQFTVSKSWISPEFDAIASLVKNGDSVEIFFAVGSDVILNSILPFKDNWVAMNLDLDVIASNVAYGDDPLAFAA